MITRLIAAATALVATANIALAQVPLAGDSDGLGASSSSATATWRAPGQAGRDATSVGHDPSQQIGLAGEHIGIGARDIIARGAGRLPTGRGEVFVQARGHLEQMAHRDAGFRFG